MPDMLRITTPLVNKVDPQGAKRAPDPDTAFDLQELQKIVKSNPQAELLKQNNGMVDKDGGSILLMNLLKDPSVTVSFLKNIFMLQEIIQLLPANNSAVTAEIEQLFQALLIQPEQIAEEMTRQEDTATVFKGDLFNFLRGLVTDPATTREAKTAVSTFLKSINNFLGNRDVLDALSNSMAFLGKSLEPSRELAGRLLELAGRFQAEDAPAHFSELRNQVLSVLKEVQDSILFSPKMEKVVSMTVYNLSRYNDNPDFLQESLFNLSALLSRQQREVLHRQVGAFFSEVQAREQATGSAVKSAGIMDVLTRILGQEANDSAISLMNSDKIEKIIHSLLSSPCNFTPLLHYVIPVQFQDSRAFAEIWINPKGQEDEKRSTDGGEQSIHVLVVFDIESVGRFEAELYVRNQVIDFSLFCPPAYKDEFDKRIRPRLSQQLAGLSYRFGTVTIDKLERTRSLMDVFRSLPYKRTGVNVKI